MGTRMEALLDQIHIPGFLATSLDLKLRHFKSIDSKSKSNPYPNLSFQTQLAIS